MSLICGPIDNNFVPVWIPGKFVDAEDCESFPVTKALLSAFLATVRMYAYEGNG